MNPAETLPYAIPANGDPRAFRWYDDKVQWADLPPLKLEWHDLPTEGGVAA